MASETRRRLDRLERTQPGEQDTVTEIRRILVEPSPDGPRETGEVHVWQRATGQWTVEHVGR